MAFKFEKLEVWVESRKFAGEIYKCTKDFPKEERFGLTDQLRRAAVSVSLNIAEGSIRGSDKDFRRFLQMSRGSLNETVSALFIALDLGYLEEERFRSLYDRAEMLIKRIGSLMKAVKDD